MNPELLAKIKIYLNELDLRDIDGIVLLGRVGTGKTSSIEGVVDLKNVFAFKPPHGTDSQEFKVSNSECGYMAMDETEYFTFGDVNNFVKAALDNKKTALFSAQTDDVIKEKLRIICDVFKSKGGSEESYKIKVIDLNKAYISHESLNNLLVDIDQFVPVFS